MSPDGAYWFRQGLLVLLVLGLSVLVGSFGSGDDGRIRDAAAQIGGAP